MAKSKEVFICQNCGAASPKWQGQCAACGEWNTLLVEVTAANPRGGARIPRTDRSSSLAAEAGLEPARPARVIDARPLRVGDLVDPAFDLRDRVECQPQLDTRLFTR